MKVAIIDFLYQTKEYFSQEMSGNFGVKTWAGNSFLARMITRSKKGIKFPVIMLAYLGAILRKNGHQVTVVENENSIQEADLYLLHSSIVNTKKEIQLCQYIKNQTGAKIGIIGPFSSFQPGIYSDSADFIIQGEPENIISTIHTREDIPEGLVKSTPVENLDSLPFPDWELFTIDKYSFKPALRKKPFLEISASRGCSSTCRYCPYRAYYGDYRGRSIASVVGEMGHLKERFDIKSLLFRDSNFTCRKKWVLELATQMVQHRFHIAWSCETRLDMLDEEILDVCREAGLQHIGVGIESLDDELLRSQGRQPIAISHIEKILRYCRNIGISVLANYIFGFPGDSRRNIMDTIRFAKKMNTPFASFHIFTPYPGTTVYQNTRADIYQDDFESFTLSTPVMRVAGLSGEELSALMEKAYVSYYFRPAWLWQHGWRHLNSLLPGMRLTIS